MRQGGYCPACGTKEEHIHSKDKKYYYCCACGNKEEKRELEDIWYTYDLSQ